jgi:hypothetical protein
VIWGTLRLGSTAAKFECTIPVKSAATTWHAADGCARVATGAISFERALFSNHVGELRLYPGARSLAKPRAPREPFNPTRIPQLPSASWERCHEAKFLCLRNCAGPSDLDCLR